MRSFSSFLRRGSNRNNPLSFSQESLWFLEQSNPHLPINNTVNLFHLYGSVNLTLLNQSLQNLLSRQSSLRTIFRLQGGIPHLVILTDMNVGVEYVDLSRSHPSSRINSAADISRREFHIPFTLTQGPLIRLKVLHFAPDDEYLVLAAHHIIFDAWSRRIFLKELFELYAEKTGHGPCDLSPLPLTYQEYSLHQREWWSGEEAKKLLSDWKDILRDMPARINYPTDYIQPDTRSYRGEGLERAITPGTYQAIREYCRQYHVTPFMVLLAAYTAVLHQYSGQDDILVGCPFANRTDVDTENLIGAFINTLPILVHLDKAETFTELTAKVRKIVLRAADGQNCPLEKIIEEINPARQHNQSFGYQVTFNLRNVPSLLASFNGFPVEEVFFEPNIIAHEMELEARDENGSLVLSLICSADIFSASTTENFLQRMINVLENGLAAPGNTLATLLRPSSAEYFLVVHEWNDSSAEARHFGCLHEQIDQVCLEQKDHAALVMGEDTLSYQDLFTQADRWASTLKTSGIGAGSVVGICLPQSFDRLIAIYAILKSGGAYLPLDPELPVERLAYMIRDSGARLVITNKSLVNLISGMNDVQSWLVDDPRIPVSLQADRQDVTRDDMAYVMYTSGSTGVPKGVAITHSNVLNYVVFLRDHLLLTSHDRMLQYSTINFDVSVEEIFGALCSGLTLILRTPEFLTSMSGFLEKCALSDINILSLPTVFWHELSTYLEDSRQFLPACIRCVIVGGEAMRSLSASSFLNHIAPKTRVFNSYGPTETTVAASFYEIQPPAESWMRIRDVPIGKPVTNTRLYILDEDMYPTPPGMPGEIYIAGAGVGPGYIHQLELNALKFLPDPFYPDTGQRMYRTGDKGYFRCDGNIVYTGRMDSQLKIRGFRIEPGEIENILLQHPLVSRAIVIARENIRKEKFLVAYIAGKTRQKISPVTVRDFLMGKIPKYMLPFAYVIMDELPTSPGGKVDQQALPPPSLADFPKQKDFSPPHTRLEKILVQVWCDVMGIDQLGVDDDFFDMGGHSLLAVRLVERIKKIVGVDISVQTLLTSPTVSSLARSIDSGHGIISPAPVIVMRSGKKQPPLFFIPAGARTTMSLHDLVSNLEISHPVYGLEYPGMHAEVKPPGTMEGFASMMKINIQKIQPHGPYYLAGKCFGGLVAFELANQFLAEGEQVDFLLLIDSFPPLKKEPNIQAVASRDNRKLPLLRKFLRESRHAFWFLKIRGAGDIQTAVFRMTQKSRSSYRSAAYPGEIILIQSEEHVLRLNKKWEPFASKVRYFNVPDADHEDLSTPDGKVTIAGIITQLFSGKDPSPNPPGK